MCAVIGGLRTGDSWIGQPACRGGPREWRGKQDVQRSEAGMLLSTLLPVQSTVDRHCC